MRSLRNTVLFAALAAPTAPLAAAVILPDLPAGGCSIQVLFVTADTRRCDEQQHRGLQRLRHFKPPR